MQLTRRDCLRLAALGAAGALLPRGLFASTPRVGAGVIEPGNPGLLILVELAGGNDGLNTLIPATDPAYAAARPTIQLSDGWAVEETDANGMRFTMHPALAPLQTAWRAGDMAAVPGLGYTTPNRSHFRSIDIWQMAGTGDHIPETGWASRVLRHLPTGDRFAEAVVLGGGGLGPTRGGGIRALAMKEPDRFVAAADKAPMVADGTTSMNPALAHVLAVGDGIRQADQVLTERLEAAPQALSVTFPDTSLGHQCTVAAQLVRLGSTPPLIHLRLKGFDTHADQLERQQALLDELATCLALLRSELIASGQWNRTTIATYAEFGRRVAENGSGGTDHGAANVQFVLGGRVRGGIHGPHPSLTELHRGDLIYTQEMHAYWRGLAAGAWGIDPGLVTGRDGDVLALHRA